MEDLGKQEGTVVELRFEGGEARRMLRSAYKQSVQGTACSQTRLIVQVFTLFTSENFYL